MNIIEGLFEINEFYKHILLTAIITVYNTKLSKCV